MDKKKRILLGAAVLVLLAVLAVLLAVLSGDREQQSVDAEALYGNYVQQVKADALVTLENNGRTDCCWQAETEENSALSVTDKSNQRRGQFRISGNEPALYERITFRLCEQDSGRCVYEISMAVRTDPNGVVSVESDGHMTYGEKTEGGQGTVLPFVSYGGANGTLCVDITPAAGGEEADEEHGEAWGIEADDAVSVLRIPAAGENGIAFQFGFSGEGETRIRLCNERLGAAISLLLERGADGVLCVKEQEVADYAPPPHDPTRFDAVRAEFAAQYGAWTLPKGAEEQTYDLDTKKQGADTDIPCGIMSFLLNGEKWIYAVSADADLAAFSKEESAACPKPDTVTVGGTEVHLYPLADSVSAFWAAEDHVYCLYGMKQDAETMTAVLWEMLSR